MQFAAADAVTGAPAALCALLDALALVGRQMHPPRLPALAASVEAPAKALRRVAAGLSEPALQAAVLLALRACEGLQSAPDADNPVVDAHRAMRLYQRAVEAVIAVESLPAISRFLLPPVDRDDPAVQGRLAGPGAAASGVFHDNNELQQRGGFSVYVPPFYDAGRSWPLVAGLHGGSGHGRLFLSNWVPLSRARGCIVVAPTAVGSTWSLMEPDIDAANLARILSVVADRWNVDPNRRLLSGMSDGGTFTLLSGLDEDSPYTHLAPVAASFHPMLLAMTSPQRLSGLPIYLTHGALDWMFPVSVGRTASRALSAAGAAVVYREVADLSHTYPADEQASILEWFLATQTNRPAR